MTTPRRTDFNKVKPEAAAVAYLAMGLWPTVIYPDQKRPIGEGWGQNRLSIDKIKSKFRLNPDAKVGVCLGPEKGPDGKWVIDAEGDGPRAEAARAEMFGGEVVDTFGWKSPRGAHSLYFADPDRMAKIIKAIGVTGGKPSESGVLKLTELPDLELRTGRDGKQFQSVAPSSADRVWNGVPTIADLPEAAYAYLEGVIANREAEAQAKAAQPTASKGGVARADNANLDKRITAYLARIDPAVSGNRGHDQTFKAACKIGPGFGLTEAQTVAYLRLWNATCVPPWSDADLERKVAEAFANEPRRGWLRDADRNGKASRNGKAATQAQANPDATQAQAQADERPDIEITTERHIVELQAIDALRVDDNLYARGSVLAEVILEKAATRDIPGGVTLRNVQGTPRVVVLSETAIGTRLTSRARFYKWIKDRNGEDVATLCHPTEWLIRGIATRQHWPGIRRLIGVSSCPYVRSDGSISATQGYDEETGTLIMAPAVTGLPDSPTQNDAATAAKVFRDLLAQFPFEADADFAVWLAGLLTMVQRAAIEGPTPGFALNGNRAGTGKGLLIDLAGIVATGTRVPTSNYPSDPAEAQKVRVGLALDGPQAVHFDNVEEGRTYGSGPLDSSMTSTEIDDRILGTSKRTGRIPLRPCWFLSGNNVSPGKDAYRRWLPCNLVTDRERPEERDDIAIRNIRQHVIDNRGKYLAAALTILKSHALAGRPSAGWPALGSFEEWDSVIRTAVWFATGLDCCATQRKAAEDSPERAQKVALLEGWRDLPGSGFGLTVGDAIDMVVPKDPRNPSPYPELYATFRSLDRMGKVNSRAIGFFIRSIKGAVFAGLRFEPAGTKGKAGVPWKVVSVFGQASAPTGDDDDNGDDIQSGPNAHAEPIQTSYTQSGKLKGAFVTSSPKSPSSPDDGSWIDPDDPYAEAI